MKKNTKQGHLFYGFNSVSKYVTIESICELFNGKLINEEKIAEDFMADCSEDNGEWLVKKVRQKGIFWWVQPIRNHKQE